MRLPSVVLPSRGACCPQQDMLVHRLATPQQQACRASAAVRCHSVHAVAGNNGARATGIERTSIDNRWSRDRIVWVRPGNRPNSPLSFVRYYYRPNRAEGQPKPSDRKASRSQPETAGTPSSAFEKNDAGDRNCPLAPTSGGF